jgi:hypothetical protein
MSFHSYHLVRSFHAYRSILFFCIRAYAVFSLFICGCIKKSLKDANGFKISRQDGISAYDRFAKTQFTLPKYLKTGVWKIEARPTAPSFGNSYFYDTRFNVLTYGTFVSNDYIYTKIFRVAKIFCDYGSSRVN